jgi:hypothetical protein
MTTTTKHEKIARPAEADEADEESFLPLTPQQLAELEKARQEAITQDAERARAYRDRVRGRAAPVESAGD